MLAGVPVPPPPDPFGRALAIAAQIVWNSEQERYRFAHLRCSRAGREYMQAAFTCHAELTDRVKETTRAFRVILLADGTPTDGS